MLKRALWGLVGLVLLLVLVLMLAVPTPDKPGTRPWSWFAWK